MGRENTSTYEPSINRRPEKETSTQKGNELKLLNVEVQ